MQTEIMKCATNVKKTSKHQVIVNIKKRHYNSAFVTMIVSSTIIRFNNEFITHTKETP